MYIPASSETAHLAKAKTGNAEAFNALVEPYRKPLLVHSYRLRGSLDDAEDIVQETFIRAWNKLNSFLGDGSFRNWLYKIATRFWLDELRKKKKQVLVPLDGPPANPDSPPAPPTTPTAWLDPLPADWLISSDPSAEASYELQENVSLAFMVALQKLNARQRVVLILRTVFNWHAEEVAETLDLTVASVNNLLYRARKNLKASRYKEMPMPQTNVDHFVRAWESGDVPTLIDLLHEKSTFAMPPMGVWYAGRDSIGRALQNFVFAPDVAWKLLPTAVNGRFALAIYQQSADNPIYHAFGLILPICNAAGGKIIEVTAFLSPHLVTRIGLPQTVTP